MERTVDGDGHRAKVAPRGVQEQAVALEQKVQANPREVVGGVEEVKRAVRAAQAPLDGREAPGVRIVRLDAQLPIHAP